MASEGNPYTPPNLTKTKREYSTLTLGEPWTFMRNELEKDVDAILTVENGGHIYKDGYVFEVTNSTDDAYETKFVGTDVP